MTIDQLKLLKYITVGTIQRSEVWESAGPYLRLNLSNPRQLLHHLEHKLPEIPVCFCGSPLNWHPDKRQYRAFCSKKCTAIGSVSKAKQTSLEKYGTEHYSQSAEFSKQVKSTSIAKFGTEHYSQTEEFKARIISTNIKNFGVPYASQSNEIQHKTEATCLARFGETSPLKSQRIKDQIEKTNIEKYGNRNPLLNPSIAEAVRQTNLAKYQVEYPSQNPNIAAKIGNTRKTNYYDPDILAKLNDSGWLIEQNKNVTISEVAKILNVSPSNLCKYYHKHNINIVYHSTTELERKFLSYFTSKNIKIEIKNRKLIAPKEIDVFFPDHNLGIEINGGYWHTEQHRPNKNDHLNKTILAEQHGFDLWQFWDWELNNNWELIISKIEHRLGLSTKLHARKLKIQLVTNQEKNEFLDANHVQGPCQSKVNIALVDHENKILMLGTFGKSRFNKNATWELIRLAATQNTSVTGGASKILSHFVKNYMNGQETLISYCHRRFSNGNVYKKLNFAQTHITAPGYVYVKQGLPAGSRNQWQKHLLKTKLSVFDETLTETENMKINGYYRAWDCGQLVFTFTKIVPNDRN